MTMEQGALTIEEAAARLGVHYMTVYRYVRTGRLPAEYRDGRWHIRPDDLDASSQGRAGRRSPGHASPSLAIASERMLDRLVAGDASGAWQIVEQSLLAGTPRDVYLQVLGPCLRTIGDRWESGALTVADEHRATAVAIGLVGRLSPMFGRRGRHRPGCVLLAGAEGDHHAIPLMMVADLLRAEGFNVIQLGADVPLATLLTMAGAADLTAVGLSASTDRAVGHVKRAIRELRRRIPPVAVMLGGPAVTSDEQAREAGADGWAPDAGAAAALALRIQRGEEIR
ncbi:MAG TPA: cobalamin-dependent protein [Acidimicrobiales bacterium]|nr:cobalamin-dependent protein [Acidimicrobiales bacterium]